MRAHISLTLPGELVSEGEVRLSALPSHVLSTPRAAGTRSRSGSGSRADAGIGGHRDVAVPSLMPIRRGGCKVALGQRSVAVVYRDRPGLDCG